MQTFLPYSRFTLCAFVLDTKRLGKQRVECRQILNAMRGLSKGWRTHPATLMWIGHEKALERYTDAIDSEWIKRGYKHTMPRMSIDCYDDDSAGPWWLGDRRVHLSHQHALVFKNAAHYAPFFDDVVEGELNYFWPHCNRALDGRWNTGDQPDWLKERLAMEALRAG